uniref:helix-turn-helix domain-containing protein n=1 Tax=Fusobacterium sp. TaxID=68766 RepID=UPI0025BF0F26
EYILEKNLNIYLDKKNNVEELEESELDTQFNKKFLKEITLNLEKKCIIEALEMFPNNLSKAAAFLGISRQSLQYKIKKFNIYIV